VLSSAKDGETVDWRMKAGLKPSPITWDLKWGFPVPTPEGEDDGMEGQVFYVWVRTSSGVSPPL
jgi:methionyl-tRNA synthetase